MHLSRFIASTLVASAAVALAFAPASQAALLFDNGSFITGTGNGSGGANTSVIGSDSDNFGFNFNNTGGFAVADDFTVPAGQVWDLDTIDVFGYQTGSTTTSSFTSAFVTVYTGAPGGTVVGGDFTTNRLSTAVWTGVYRVSTTALTGATRPIMQLTLDTSFLPNLAAGTYWVGVSATGSVASGPWAVPLSPTPTGANAQQLSAGAWGVIDNHSTTTGIQPTGIAFRVNGTSLPVTVPETGTGALFLLGPATIAFVAARRRFCRA